MTAILTEIITLLVGGIQQLGAGIATGANAYVQALFISGTGSAATLSTFGGIVVVFAAIALAVGLTTLLFNWLRSLGN